jgi:hypothetical protein
VVLQSAEAEPSFHVSYAGKGKWLVIKTCEVNPANDGAWFFNERDSKLVWNQDYYDSINSKQ